MPDRPKYSVIIPSRNGCKYLPYAIRSVLEQRFENFELIVSDNHSGDDTWAFLSTLSDPRLRIFQPTDPLSLARHFEFAISQAKGDWITVLGDDDSLQPYFFNLAEKLTLASPHPVISSPRAYYFWPGCEIFYSDAVVSYAALRKTSTRCSLSRLLRLLLFPGYYFEEPQFYTGTLFRSEIYKDIKNQQGGVVFKSPIFDANSVSLIFKQTPRYTFSHIPLAWIGSSPKSTGFAQSDAAKNSGDSQKMVNDFDALNLKDKILTNPRFPFSTYIHNVDAYFLEAFIQVHSESSSGWATILKFKPAIYLLFGKIYKDYAKETAPGVREAYEKTFAANGLNLLLLGVISRLISFIYTIEKLIRKPFLLLKRLLARDSLRPKAVFSSNLRAEFPTILHASAKSKDLYDKKLS